MSLFLERETEANPTNTDITKSENVNSNHFEKSKGNSSSINQTPDDFTGSKLKETSEEDESESKMNNDDEDEDSEGSEDQDNHFKKEKDEEEEDEDEDDSWNKAQ